MINEVYEETPDIEDVARTLNLVIRGRSNAVSTVTLDASSTSTTVTDNNFEHDQAVLLIPTTENAANATVWLSERTVGEFTLGHDSTADTDRTFLYFRVG